MVEQVHGFVGIGGPGYPFDFATGKTRLTPIIGNSSVLAGEGFQGPHASPGSGSVHFSIVESKPPAAIINNGGPEPLTW